MIENSNVLFMSGRQYPDDSLVYIARVVTEAIERLKYEEEKWTRETESTGV